MPTAVFSALLRSLLLSFGLLLPTLSLRAQTAVSAPHSYDFMTVIAAQTTAAKSSQILFFPAFNGKAEIQLATVSNYSYYYGQDNFKKNTELINQQLGAITAQGWELIQVLPSSSLTVASYLFRKARF